MNYSTPNKEFPMVKAKSCWMLVIPLSGFCRFLSCLFFLTFSAAVCSGDPAPTLMAIQVQGDSLPTVGVAKLESALSPMSPIGRNKEEIKDTITLPNGKTVEISKTIDDYYRAEMVVNEKAIENYRRIMEEELARSGYRSKAVYSLFEDSTVVKSRILFGGILVKCNTRNKTVGIGKTNVELHFEEIAWQVYDTKTKEVIFRQSTNGFSKRNRGTLHEVAIEAFRYAFRNLLANPDLVNTLKKVSESGE